MTTEEIKQLRKQGLTLQAIADRAGATRQSVWSRLNWAKVYPRMKVYQQTDKYKAYQKTYQQTDKYKAYQKAYQQTDKRKAYQKTYRKARYHKLHPDARYYKK